MEPWDRKGDNQGFITLEVDNRRTRWEALERPLPESTEGCRRKKHFLLVFFLIISLLDKPELQRISYQNKRITNNTQKLPQTDKKHHLQNVLGSGSTFVSAQTLVQNFGLSNRVWPDTPVDTSPCTPLSVGLVCIFHQALSLFCFSN